jgi:tetratricopeptide (TPR) repeat protein
MELLHEAVTAGYSNVAHMIDDKDLDALRDRDDFRKMMIDLLDKALAAQRSPNADESPESLSKLFEFAKGYAAVGLKVKALKLHEETMARRKAKLGPDHSDTHASIYEVALALAQQGRLDEAFALGGEIIASLRTQKGPDHPETLAAMRLMAENCVRFGRHADAVKVREEILALVKAKLGPEHPDTLESENELCLIFLKVAAQQAWSGEDKKLAETCGRALELAKDTNDPSKAERTAKMCSVRPTEDTARLEAALTLARKAVELGRDHRDSPWFYLSLGMVEYRRGHFAEADAALITAAETDSGSMWGLRGTAAFYRAMSLYRQGKHDEARKLAAEAASNMKPLPVDAEAPQNHDDLILWMAYKEAKALIK